MACQRALGFSHLAWIRAIRRGILRNLVSGRRGTRHPGTRRLDTRRPCTRRPDTQRPCTGVPACRHAASRQSASRHPASAVVTGIGRLCSAPTMPGNRKCRKRFGFCSRLSTKAVRRGELTHGLAGSRWLSCFPLAELLLKPSTRQMVKKYLLEAGILVNVCEECGREWRGKPITIQVDHRNGIRDDHRFENLRIPLPELSQSDGHIRSTKSQTITRKSIFMIRDSETVSRLTLTQVFGVRIPVPERPALSSRGLGRRPLTAVTRVRIPLGLPRKPCFYGVFSLVPPRVYLNVYVRAHDRCVWKPSSSHHRSRDRRSQGSAVLRMTEDLRRRGGVTAGAQDQRRRCVPEIVHARCGQPGFCCDVAECVRKRHGR